MNGGMSDTRRDLTRADAPYILFFLVFLVFFFHKIIFTGQTYFIRDAIMQFSPWKAFAAGNISNGKIPLWNPYTYCGMPFLANMQSALFYPPGIVFYFLPFVTAYKLYILFHFAAAFFFMYALMKDFGTGKISSFLAGIVFAFNGYLLSRIEFLSVLGTSVWLPLTVLLIRRFSRTRLCLKNTNLLGSVLSIQFLAGHPQVFVYSLITLFFFSVFSSVRGKNLRSLYIFFASGIIAALASAIQLIPSLEFIYNSARGAGLDYSIVSIASLPPREVLSLFVPFLNFKYSANNWPFACYAGLLPFVFALCAIFGVFRKFIPANARNAAVSADEAPAESSRARRWNVYFFMTLFVLSVLYALGKYNPLFGIFCRIFTPANAFRYPATALYISVFSIAALAGFGFEGLRLSPGWGIFLVLFTMFDLFFVGSVFNQTTESSIYRYYGPKTMYLMKQKGSFRIFPTPKTIAEMTGHGSNFFRGWVDVKDNMFGDVNMNYRIFNARGQDLFIERYRKFLFLIDSQGSAGGANKLLSLANVKYVLSPGEIKSPEYREVIGGEMKMYENKNCLPRVFIVHQAKVMKNSKILDYMAEKSFDPGKEVVLETGADLDASVPQGKFPPRSSAEVIKYEPDEVYAAVRTVRDGFLVISDTFYPGWKAFVDGIKTQIYRADYVFRAVKVPAGEHIVKFIYEPLSYKIGEALTLLTLLFIIVVIFRF